MSAFVIIETTFPNREEGEKMASLLIERRVCACCHLMDISSCYRFDGSVERAKEVLLRCKTTQQAQKAAIDCIVSHHSYSVPEIIVMEVACPHAAYADWIENEVTLKDLDVNNSDDSADCDPRSVCHKVRYDRQQLNDSAQLNRTRSLCSDSNHPFRLDVLGQQQEKN